MHSAYLFEVKKPVESTAPLDYYKLVGITSAENAFVPWPRAAARWSDQISEEDWLPCPI